VKLSFTTRFLTTPISFLGLFGTADLTFFIAFSSNCGVLKTFDGDAAGLEAGL